MANPVWNAVTRAAAEGLAASRGRVKAGPCSTKKQFIVALVLFLLAVVIMQQVAWSSFPYWVKQQVVWDVLRGITPEGQQENYSPRMDRNQWYRINHLHGGNGGWVSQLWKNASYGWCDKMACPFSTVLQQPAADGWWLANSPAQCPDYFRWIREDLAPWSDTGVTLDHVLAGRDFGHFRVTIVKGKLYAEYYKDTWETRGPFTLWGLDMLLERYPGLVPDVDIVFSGGDWPTVPKKKFRDAAGPIPLVFSYCTTAESYNVPFPDWSFWGWPEVRVFPWEVLGGEIFHAAEVNRWEDRENISYWRGNPDVGGIRRDLLACDVSRNPSSTVHAVSQDWGKERANGFQSSNLASHCKYKYMIYAEGNAWSVSYKYTMACGSPMLAIESPYYEFFTRSLQPNVHYLPVSRTSICSSIDAQVNWATSHRDEAETVARRGVKFLKEDLTIDFIYDYMLHLLQAYAKLQRFQPTVPPHAEELCPAKLLCSSGPSAQAMMRMNTIQSRIAHQPCVMKPPAP